MELSAKKKKKKKKKKVREKSLKHWASLLQTSCEAFF